MTTVDLKHTFSFDVGSEAREDLLTALGGGDAEGSSVTVTAYGLTKQEEKQAARAASGRSSSGGQQAEGSLLGTAACF